MSGITTPTGRIVSGSVYQGNDKDADGNLMVYKSGANIGQPRKSWYIGLAIPKAGESHWSQTAWGAEIYRIARESFPKFFDASGNCLLPTFAFKVTDGDSIVPNKKGIAPNTREGYAGNWVLSLSNGFAPSTYELKSDATVVANTDDDYIKRGYYAQVYFDCTGNGSPQQPGVYLNMKMVCMIAKGQEILGVDPNAVGFGVGALPAGVQPSFASPSAPNAAFAAPVVAAPVAPAPVVAAPIPPAHDIVNVAAGRPTLKAEHIAAGLTYESMISQGWTDDLLRQHGYMA